MGHWWTVEKPELKIPGTLRFNQNGIKLELIGLMGEDILVLPKLFTTIFGKCEGGLITLVDGFEASVKNAHIITSTLIFNKIIIGSHIKEIKNFKISDCTVELTNLEYWFDYFPFKNNVSALEENNLNAMRTFGAYIKSKGLYIQPGGRIITQDSTKNYQGPKKEYKPELQLRSNQPESLLWFEQIIIELKNLIAILTDSPIFIKSIIFSVDDRETLRYYPLPDKNYQEKKVGLCFTALEIESSLEKILNNWFDTKVDNAHQLYLRNIFEDSKLSQEDIFLNYAKAIESFHRDAKEAGKFVSNEEYTEIVNTMIDTVKLKVSEELLNKLKATLKYANEYGFQRRIKEILKELPIPIQNIVLDGKRIPHLADEIRNHRDYYTHFGDQPNNIYSLKELMDINDKLKLVLQFTILNELGLNIKEFLRNFESDIFYASNLLR